MVNLTGLYVIDFANVNNEDDNSLEYFIIACELLLFPFANRTHFYS